MSRRKDYRQWVEWESCFVCIYADSDQCNDGSGYTLQDEHGVCPVELDDEDMTYAFEACSFEEYCRRRNKEGW